MTYEEAHAYLENLQREFTTNRQAYANDLITANGKAIEALEKQIPKKPVIKVYYDEDEETHKKYKWKFYVCSVCGENIALKSYTHCHCGQAIDWSE